MKSLDELIEKVNHSNFATIKGIMTQIFEILSNSKSSVNDLERIIKLDPPLASRVLKVANSAYFASKIEFTDLKEAVLWIGFDEIKNIAITQQFYKLFFSESVNHFSRKDLWSNSIAGALLSKMIYRREYGQKGEDIYTAGLIRNIGIIILDQFLSETFIKILETCEETRKPQIEIENEMLGYDHALIANHLAENWNFPTELRNLLNYHHNPEKAPQEYQKGAETLYIADYHCNKLNIGYSDHTYKENDEHYYNYLKNNDIEIESLNLLNVSLKEQIEQLQNVGLLTHG